VQNYKVIRCSTDNLERELNELGEQWLPLVWNFSRDIPPSHASVICIRPPRQQQVGVPIQFTPPRGGFGPR
jgi:hypothetical protein